MSRPTVSVFSIDSTIEGNVTLPAVFTAPIRADVVHYVHTLMAKNARQAYAVKVEAGHDNTGDSWGTGRAVSRIPRVHGGGTQRSGQAAFGNMCRAGRMFAPTKVWRRWHRKISVNQRRFAVSSALAATAVPSLVLARGHRIEDVPEFPLVLSDSLNSVQKTKDAKSIIAKVGALADVEKSKNSQKIRRGVGKSRNRRYVNKKGPLVVYDVSEGIDKGFRNLPGVELAMVENLSLLDLAPGGHLGRFCIWTKGAFEKLDSLFGTYEEGAQLKNGFNLPRSSMSNADLARIINSDEIQSIVKPAVAEPTLLPKRSNPLRNRKAKISLNPHHVDIQSKESALKDKDAAVFKAKSAARKALRGKRKSFFRAVAKEGEFSF